MTETEKADPDAAALRARALELRAIAREVHVMAGTMAERDLERARAELEEVIAAIGRGEMQCQAIADRLKGIGITIESAIYMGGWNAPGASSVTELQGRLTAWFARG